MSVMVESKKTALTVWSMFVGLGVTLRNFFGPQETIHYPRQTIDDEILKSFRGPIELVESEKDPLIPKCVSCMTCVSACPSSCLSVTKRKPPVPSPEELIAQQEAEVRGEPIKKKLAPKNPAAFSYNYTTCSLCGTCVSICPVGSLRFSHDIYLAGFSRQEYQFDLLNKLQNQALQTGSSKSTPSGNE
jgi:NADH-quinone oxidoreductase subunit I